MADEEAKLLAELKYLTNLISLHKDEKTHIEHVRKPQQFQLNHGQYSVQGTCAVTRSQSCSGRGNSSKAQYSWTKPCKMLEGNISSKKQILSKNVVSATHIPLQMAQKCCISIGASNTRKLVTSPLCSVVDTDKGPKSTVVKTRTVVALSKGCEKRTVAVAGSCEQHTSQKGTRVMHQVGMPLLYSKSQSDDLVNITSSPIPSRPTHGKKRTVVLSPKKAAGGNSQCNSSPMKKLFVEAVNQRPQHVSESVVQSGCNVKPLSLEEAGTKISKRTVCIPDAMNTATCPSVDVAGGKFTGQIGSQSSAKLSHVATLKVEDKCERMVQVNKYKVVRMSPTKVTAAAVVPMNFDMKPTYVTSPLSAAVCATKTSSTPSSTTVTHQSRHRLVKVHKTAASEETPSTETCFTCKPAVMSSGGTKLREHGRYKLTRQSSKTRRRRHDSVHSKRRDVQSKYKLVRNHGRGVAVSARDTKTTSVCGSVVEPDDKLSLGAQANKFTRAPKPLKTVPQNHDVVSAKRHIILSKYKLVKRGISVTSLRRTTSKNRLVKKAASGTSWVPVRSFYNPSILRSRRERRQIKLPATWKKRYSIKRNSTDHQDTSINELLGRKVTNLSRNKYKFIRGGKRNTPLTNMVASRSSLKVDHRKKQTRGSSRSRRSSAGKYVLIGGEVFKSSKNKLTRQTSLKRMRSGSVGMVNKGTSQHRWRASVISPVPSFTPSSARILASRAIYRSILTSSAAKYRKNNTVTRVQQQYCMFYNRFGKCNRGEKCPYIHDPEKVAVCTRFLRGTCKVTDCPFSHKVAPEKMPVCRFFLRGVCHKEDCPYLHVNVNRNAQICPDFLRGYCPLGDKCKKKHSLVCVDFERTGSCPRGSECKMQHPQKTARNTGMGRRKRKLATALGTGNLMPELSGQLNQDSNEAVTSEREIQEDNKDGDDINLPLKSRKLPSFIALEPSDRGPVRNTKKENLDESIGVTPLQIRPRLSFTPEDEEEATPK